MADVDKIQKLLHKHFDYTGRVSIDKESGRVSCSASMNLKKDVKVAQLPVEFDDINGHFNCEDNYLTSLKGAPVQTGLYFSCKNNPLESLKGLPLKVGALCWVTWTPQLPLLRLLQLTWIRLPEAPQAVDDIINKYLGQGKSGALKCAAELIKAGYRDNARW